MERPKCPVCKGLLEHEPASAYTEERVFCRLCGWTLMREPQSAPIDKELIATPPPKIRNARGHRGTCCVCHRDNLVLIKAGGPCHTCYKHKKKAEQAALETLAVVTVAPTEEEVATFTEEILQEQPCLDPEPITPAAEPAPPVKKSKAVRGTCPICKRDDVLLTSKNGECHRCYKRAAEGHDPLTKTRAMPIYKRGPHVPKLVMTFSGDNLAVIQRFADLSKESGGTTADDLCTIIDLYLDEKLQLREAA